MTGTLPSQRIERLLSGLGASAAFRDAVLGDLAEEFASQAGRDGARAARHWYYREALRTVPHLARDWWRGLHPAEVRRLFSTIALSYVLMLIVALFASLTVVGIAHAVFGINVTPVRGNDASFVFTIQFLFVAGIQAVVGGFIAACIDDRAPLMTALALGVVWASLIVIGALAAMTAAPVLWTLPCAILGPLAGAALRVGIRRSVPVSISPSTDRQ